MQPTKKQEFNINPKNKERGDLGFIINPDYWNKGFATEASKGLIDFMALNYSIMEIEADCDVLNLASKKVLEKCGLKIKEEIKGDIAIKGRVRNSYYFKRKIKEFNKK